MNILFTSVGRRVELLKAFRHSMNRANIAGKIITTDLKKSAPASFFADAAELVPKIGTPDYIERLLDICDRHQIDLLIPLIDPELSLLSLHRKKFLDRGVTLLVSSVKTNEICYSKKQTGAFFKSIGIGTPKIYNISEIEERHFSLIVKPDTGSSSAGVYHVRDRTELRFLSDYIQDGIIQERIIGEEYTIDILVGFKGNVISIVP